MPKMRGNRIDSHSSGDTTGDERLADAEDRVAGGLDALPRELGLLSREVDDRRDRRLPRVLPHHILRRHGISGLAQEPGRAGSKPSARRLPVGPDRIEGVKSDRGRLTPVGVFSGKRVGGGRRRGSGFAAALPLALYLYGMKRSDYLTLPFFLFSFYFSAFLLWYDVASTDMAWNGN